MNRDKRFLELFLQHQHEVRAFVASIVRDWHRGEDIAQELALILWNKFDEYDPNRSFGAWARGIASNLILRDYARHRRAMSSLSPEAIQAIQAAYDTEIIPTASLEQEALRFCMKRLSDRAQQLVRLRYNEDLGPQALAERAGSTIAAVNRAMNRIRVFLRDCVRERLARPEGA